MSIIRRKTREVAIGHLPLGSDHPIRIQSMTNTDTLNTEACVKQIITLTEAGSEYVRLTVPSVKEAYNLENIRREIEKKGIKTPLIADIHYTPQAAFIAADYVHKIRINPGNFGCTKHTKTPVYTSSQYQDELKTVKEKLSQLLEKLKRNSVALRIGVNHGSLSDRIMDRFGNTVEGMVFSSIELIDMSRELDFHQIVVSMKASHPMIMIEAYRLLVQEMDKRKMDYPLHLGVTEAGFGFEGRIKSAVGIGALLLEGLGDTLRVSLTEPPEEEIPVARKLVQFLKESSLFEKPSQAPFFQSSLKTTDYLKHLSHTATPLVGFAFSTPGLSVQKQKSARQLDFVQTHADKLILVKQDSQKTESLPDIEFKAQPDRTFQKEFLNLIPTGKDLITLLTHREIQAFSKDIILNYPIEKTEEDQLLLYAMELGYILSRIRPFGILLSGKTENETLLLDFIFEVLQALKLRITKTEFISCPTCGRTQFDLISTAKKVKAATEHLKGLKIGVMGCIVNGPGEMADADYGYVGSGPGKVTLFKGKEIIARNIPHEEAVLLLIEQIKKDGRWQDPLL